MSQIVTTYPVPAYVAMVSDELRYNLYAGALREAVTPGCTVLEIGTGIGVFAVLCRLLGAAHVVAVEPSEAINVARLVAKENNVGDIVFVQGLSTDVDLPVLADVIVSDLHGVLPQMEGHIEAIVDARTRLLAPGGTLIPRTDTMYAALVDMPTLYADRIGSQLKEHGFHTDVLTRFATNSWTKVRLKSEHLLTEGVCWGTVDYRTATTLDICGTASWVIARAGVAHGAAIWFDSRLTDRVTFSNAPGAAELIYGQSFFPFSEPVAVSPGDIVSIRFEARHVTNEYVWRWDTTVQRSDGSAAMAFRQSTFLAQPYSPGTLARADGAHVPVLGEDGRVERVILNAIDGNASNADIAQDLMRLFPHRFSGMPDALGRVARTSLRFRPSAHEVVTPSLVSE